MLDKLRTHIKTLGPGSALLFWTSEALKRLGGGVSLNREIVYAQPVRDSPLLPRGLGRSIVVRELSPDDVVFATMPGGPGVVRYRLAQSSVCLAAFEGDKMVGFIWLCLSPYREDVMRCTFAPSEGTPWSWDYGLYVEPNARGGLVFPRLWDAANDYLRERGIGWTFSRISAFNLRSIGPHEKLGARRLGTIVFISLGPAQVMWSSLLPRLHISLNQNSVPTVRLGSPPLH